MLPTPHGPSDAPLPPGAADTTEGRTPDAVALLRVVEHLADVPDGEDATGETTQPDDEATGETTQPDDEATGEASDDETPADEPTTDEPTTDEPTDDEATDDETPADEPTTDEPTTDEPTTDEPTDDEPTDDEPTAQEPTAGTPEDEVPAGEAPPPGPAPEVGPVAAALSDTRHRLDELNAAERLFLGQQRSLVAELCTDPSDAQEVSDLFDRVHAQWQAADERPDLRPLADAFGVALGDLVCGYADDLGWARFSDRFGTEIVLAREEPEVVVYPIAAVAQHWPDATPGWFLRHLTTVLQGLAPGPRPAAS